MKSDNNKTEDDLVNACIGDCPLKTNSGSQVSATVSDNVHVGCYNSATNSKGACPIELMSSEFDWPESRPPVSDDRVYEIINENVTIVDHVLTTDLSLVRCNEGSNEVTSTSMLTFSESLFGAPATDESSNDDVMDALSCTQSISSDLLQENMFTFLNWNVNGIMTKVFDNDFILFVSSFHFICLVETFVESLNYNAFPGYKIFCKSSVKLSAVGRSSGGIICLIRNELVPYVRQIEVNTGNFLLFVIDKTLLGLDKDLLYVCVYIPPEGSRYYNVMGLDGDGIIFLEDTLIEHALTTDL